jgi:hypothetical protein
MATAAEPTPPSFLRKHWFLLALLVLFAGLGIQYGIKAHQGGSAFVRWREQILDLDRGEDVYTRYNYPNPPIMALLLTPLVQLDSWVELRFGGPSLAGPLAWFCLKVAMTLAALFWVFRMVEDPERPFPGWAKALTVLLALRPIMGDLYHGNVNLLILFLVIAALYSFQRGRDFSAGLVLALAIACKVTPALFLPYFAWKRAWKTLIGCTAGMGLFFWVVPACFLGWNENAHELASWADQMVKPFVIEGKVTSEHNNQSLPGLCYRLLTHSPSFSTYEANVYTHVDYHNMVDLSPSVVPWLLKGCMLAFVVLMVWTCRAPLADRQGWRFPAEFSIILIGMLLFSERTWKHHCVTLVLPFAVLAYALATQPADRRLPRWLIFSLASAMLLMATTSTSFPGWHDSAKIAQVYGAYVWTYLILLAALVALLRGQGVRTAALKTPTPEARTIRIEPTRLAG